jgi:hypothetical protein
MKNLVIILSLFMFFGTSCNSIEKKVEKKLGEKLEEAGKALDTSGEKIANCDEFLKKYEKWVDDYLVVLAEYHKNPNQETIEKFMKMAQDGMGWAVQWSAMYDCASQDKYEKEFDRIEKKVEDKLKELGME